MKKKKQAQPPRLETDERVERSKKTVLATTYELLTKSGFGGVSVDEVSRRSGVAKTTIYRHWPSRESLLMDACSQLSSRPVPPDTGSMKRDLEFLAVMIVNRIREPWSTILPSIIDAAERDRNLADLQSRIHAQMRSAFGVVIDRGRQRGEIPKTHDTRVVIASILGPLFYRRWFSREPLDEAFAKQVVDRAMR
jgi:AcrR family transcriptional regulator